MNGKKRTKIIATLGPASNNKDMLERLFVAGVNLVRLNLSHGTLAEHQKTAMKVRAVAESLGIEIGIIVDLQGPKLRITQINGGKVKLTEGDSFTINVELGEEFGTQNEVGVTYPDLIQNVAVGDILVLDDGLIKLKVKNIAESKIDTVCLEGGVLHSQKGINKLMGGLAADALTRKDLEALAQINILDPDYVAVSFVKEANDILEVRQLLKNQDCQAGVIAKIERHEAIENLDDIIDASDAVMVARGDLGVEIGDASLPGAQKKIISRARHLNKAVITATQMMESMIYNPIPTRAEVSDVGNAVLDGTDAVMLSAETAVGKYPERVVKAMARVCVGVEKERITKQSQHRMKSQFTESYEAIAMATMYTANHLPVTAIVSLTESGLTPLWMSRIRSGISIYGFSRHRNALRKMTLYRGVYPVFFDLLSHPVLKINQAAVQHLQELRHVVRDDLIILTRGDVEAVPGVSNTMKIIRVEKLLID